MFETAQVRHQVDERAIAHAGQAWGAARLQARHAQTAAGRPVVVVGPDSSVA